MSRIKSALELALERSSDVPINKESIQRDEWVRRGKALGGKFLSNPTAPPLSENIDAPGTREKTWFYEGLIDTFLANITLPRFETDVSQLDKVNQGVQTLGTHRKANTKMLKDILKQLRSLSRQYLDNVSNIEEQMRQQWEPRLRQKEQILRQQTGQTVTLSPEQDPEFNSALKNQLASLSGQYNEALQRGKSEIRRILLG